MDTRMNMSTLLDYKEYYGFDKTYLDAQELIKGIPSITLLNYISGFNVNLYLNENNDKSGKVQFSLVESLLGKCDENARKKWVSVIKKQVEEGFSPVIFWNYSNLLFYGLIFTEFNNLPSRDVDQKEAQKIFDAYLIINGVANEKIKVEEGEIDMAANAEKIENIIIPKFIYQKDYISTTDFSNQITRGVQLFRFLESHPKFSPYMKEYYQSKKIVGYLRMFKNFMYLFCQIGIELDKRSQIAPLSEFNYDLDSEFLNSLSINRDIKSYTEDESFRILRNKFLYQINGLTYFILDVNFLIDQFYKAQVFSLNDFFKTKGIDNFLSKKAKEFTEEIYMPNVFRSCFPGYVSFFGKECVNSKKEELCDAYLRNENNVCLVEFKDVLLNGVIKNSGVKDVLFDELDIKFLANQKKKAKGITQLLEAIEDIESNSILFDRNAANLKLKIYPIVLYTDFSFGIEGLNKQYKEKFDAKLKTLNLKNVVVKPVTFINLNFFELREDYFSQKLMDLFIMLDEYHKHLESPDYQLTTFEVFSRFYMNDNVHEDLELPSLYRKYVREIIAS